jgi:hypothetical protein
MKISYFTETELQTYYNNKEIIFFHFRKCYILEKTEKNNFQFIEHKPGSIKNGLPHTKKGRFHAFKLTDSYSQEYFK